MLCFRPKTFGVLLGGILLPELAGAQATTSNPYLPSIQIAATYAADTTPFRHQTAAWNYSFIGEYQKALQVWDSGGRRNPLSVSSEDSAAFRRLRPQSAREYILNRARTERVILINEAHHNPQHRVFTASLLEELYRQGYRYFLAESIDSADTFLPKRKYPVLATGFYVREPQYGNLLREAFRCGYGVRGYDFGSGGGGKEREIVAARQVAAILARDSGARIIIHCGFDHIVETEYRGWEKALAGRIAEYTGINPFTIDQTKLSGTGRPEYAHPFYRMASNVFAIHEASVFVDSTGRPFNGVFSGPGRWDVQVLHPSGGEVAGRPYWLFGNGREAQFIRPEGRQYPLLLVAYAAGEDTSQAVPVDVVEIKRKEDAAVLVLPNGNFIIVCLYADGKRQKLKVKR